MGLHPLAEGFADVADAYERGRPEYMPAVAQTIMAELSIASGERVLDLAAGTGKLTRALVRAGLDVIAVEPQARLRDVLAASVGAERVLEGSAEQIPLPSASVAAVTVADAFHWFDQAAALQEIGRVLRPRGGLAVLRVSPDWSGASWSHEVGSLISKLGLDHPQFQGPHWQDAARAQGCWTEPRQVQLTMSQRVDPEVILDYIASISWMAALPADERTEIIAKARELIVAGETPDELPIHVAIRSTKLLVPSMA